MDTISRFFCDIALKTPSFYLKTTETEFAFMQRQATSYGEINLREKQQKDPQENPEKTSRRMRGGTDIHHQIPTYLDPPVNERIYGIQLTVPELVTVGRLNVRVEATVLHLTSVSLRLVASPLHEC